MCLDSSIVNNIVVLMVKVLVQAKVQKATAVFSDFQSLLTALTGSHLFFMSWSSSPSSRTPALVISDGVFLMWKGWSFPCHSGLPESCISFYL